MFLLGTAAAAAAAASTAHLGADLLVMALCDKRYTATQFALLTAIASLGRVFSGPLAGNLVAAWDWTTFFVFTVAVGLMPLVILPLVRGQLNRLDGET